MLSLTENELFDELQKEYDLDNRVIEFAGKIIDLTETLPKSRAGNHIAGQLLRAGTAPAPNYAEAQGAESRDDFIHKMGVCLKELRESFAWLRISRNKKLADVDHLRALLKECEELIRIFKTSIQTARNNRVQKQDRRTTKY